MYARVPRSFAGGVFICLASLTAAAAEPAAAIEKKGERFALLVGVRQYDETELRGLPYSEDDVSELAKVLIAAGYDRNNVVLMTQKVGAEKTRYLPVAANIRKELALLLKHCEKPDSVLIAFAGHGVQFAKEEHAYFCPADAKLADRATLLPLGEIYSQLEKCNAGFKLLLVDACRNNPQPDTSRSRAEVDLASVSRPQEQLPPGGVAAFFSCSAGEKAFENAELRHGIFFNYVIEALQGKAALDSEKDVTLPELEAYVKRNTIKYARAKFGVDQVPELVGKTSGLVSLVRLHRGQEGRLTYKLPDFGPANIEPPLLKGPRAVDRQIAQEAVRMLQAHHLSKHPLDAEVSRRCLHMFLKRIDPSRLYFLQSDIDKFNLVQDRLCDQISQGDVKFAYTVYTTYLARLDEAMHEIDGLLKMPHDFTDDEEMPTDAKEFKYAVSRDELNDRWRQRVKYELLQQKMEQVSADEAQTKLSRRQHAFVRRNHLATADDLLESYLTALALALDPHSTYMSPISYENLLITSALKLEGIGATMNFDNGEVQVVSLAPGGAAEKDGRLKAGDRVVGVGQDAKGEIVDTTDLPLNEVVKLVRGKAGSVVRIKVIPAGQTAPQTYDITRAKIDLTLNESHGELIDGVPSEGQTFRVGVIDVPTIYSSKLGPAGSHNAKNVTDDVKKLLEGFRKQKADAVVIDLRRNGGGVLAEAISLTGLFIDEGPVVQVKGADGKVLHYDDKEKGMAWEGPLVMLVSKNTGSGAEMFVGAIQDYRRGLVVGDDSTYGNGTVQSLFDLGKQISQDNPPKLGAIKITTQQFYRPNGNSMQSRGIAADVSLPSRTMRNPSEKDLEHALKFDLVDAAKFTPLHMVNNSMISDLRNRSGDRVEKSDDFKKLQEKIARQDAQALKKTVSLNEKEFAARWSQAAVEKEPPPATTDDGRHNAIVRDFYLDEVLAIAADYARLTKNSGR